MRRIEARRRKASALRFRHSQSLAKRRQRLSHAIVRSTIQRFGSTTNLRRVGPLDDLNVTARQTRQPVLELRPLVAGVGVKLYQERKHSEQRAAHEQHAAVAILDIGRMYDGVHQQALRVDEDMPLFAVDLLAPIEPGGIDRAPLVWGCNVSSQKRSVPHSTVRPLALRGRLKAGTVRE